MDTFELIDKLLQKSSEEIEYALFAVLMQGKLDFVKLSNMYVKSLEAKREDMDNKMIEAETCILESFLYKKSRSKDKDKSKDKFNWKHTQRSLYFLNQGKRLNMSSMNKEYEYDEEEAKKLSWYERNKGL